VNDPDINEIITVGEIGTTPIENIVNGLLPVRELDQGVVYIFEGTRDGVLTQYYYKGLQGISVGAGENSTLSTDYIDLTNTEPEEPDLSDYATIQHVNDQKPETAIYYLTDDVQNISTSNPTEDFLLVEDDEAYYFGQKDGNVIDFDNCTLVIDSSGYKYDFGVPITVAGYTFWKLGDTAAISLTAANGEAAFSYFRKFAAQQITTDASLHIDENGLLISNVTGITERFIYDGSDNVFVLTQPSTRILGIRINRSIALDFPIDYLVNSSTEIEITYPITTDDQITIIYEHLIYT
jgi:hypothetical protein